MVVGVVNLLAVLALGLLLGAVAVVALWHAYWRSRMLVRRRVLVSLVGGEHAVSGVLWARRGGFLVLKDAAVLAPGSEPVAADGDVVIEQSRVDYVQAAG